eukprot:300890-Chlamydomonas_euryale.AAC.2
MSSSSSISRSIVSVTSFTRPVSRWWRVLTRRTCAQARRARRTQQRRRLWHAPASEAGGLAW